MLNESLNQTVAEIILVSIVCKVIKYKTNVTVSMYQCVLRVFSNTKMFMNVISSDEIINSHKTIFT